MKMVEKFVVTFSRDYISNKPFENDTEFEFKAGGYGVSYHLSRWRADF